MEGSVVATRVRERGGGRSRWRGKAWSDDTSEGGGGGNNIVIGDRGSRERQGRKRGSGRGMMDDINNIDHQI